MQMPLNWTFNNFLLLIVCSHSTNMISSLSSGNRFVNKYWLQSVNIVMFLSGINGKKTFLHLHFYKFAPIHFYVFKEALNVNRHEMLNILNKQKWHKNVWVFEFAIIKYRLLIGDCSFIILLFTTSKQNSSWYISSRNFAYSIWK